MILFKRLISISIILISLSFIILSWNIPISKMWKGYTVLYADVGIAENTVLSVLSKAGCEKVITLSSQEKNEIKPLVTVHFLSDNSRLSDYRQRIKNYFFDEQKKYQLYYVNDNDKSKLDAALKTLQSLGSCGLDVSFLYPLYVPIICLLFFVFLLSCAENRLPFTLFSLFPLTFSLVVPNSINGSASVLLLYGCFLLQLLYPCQNAIVKGFHNVYILILLLFPIAICAYVSLKNLLLCSLTSLCVLLSALMILQFKGKSYVSLPRSFRVGRANFSPISIIPHAYSANVITRESADCLFLCAGAILLQIVFSLFPQQHLSASSSTNLLSLPSPVLSVSGKEELPNLKDFLDWSWKTVTFEYKNLNAKESDVVEVPFYKMEGTRAVKTVSKRFVYGDEFLEKMLDEYATLAEPRIETLLREQGENSHFSYSSSSGGVESLGSMTLFILLITVCIPLGMALYYILQKKKAVCQ